MVLDECHRFLDKPSSEIVHFFAYHGHYGFDIIFITQSPYLIPRKLTVLAEVEYTAVRRSFRIRNELRYSVGAAGEKTDVHIIKDPSKYFNLYKSASVHSKPKKQVIKFVIVFGVLAAVAVGSIGFMVYRFSTRGDEKKKVSYSSVKEGSALPRERAGVSAPPRKSGYVWQDASTVAYSDGKTELIYLVVDGGLHPIGPYIKEGVVKRRGRTFQIYAPAPKPEREDGDGIFDNRGNSGGDNV